MQAIEEIILGNSLVIKEMKKLIEMVSSSTTTVLIQGETGTGKELVAEALHAASGRKGNNMKLSEIIDNVNDRKSITNIFLAGCFLFFIS